MVSHARRRAPLLVTIACCATLVACSGQNTDTQQAQHDIDSEILNEATQRVQEATRPLEAALPDSSPPIQSEKSLVLVTCSLASEGCAQPAHGAKDAAEAVGWEVKIIDGKDTADTQNAAVRQALALNPDGLITFAINPESIQGSLEEAKRQGVKVIASSSAKSDLVDYSDIPNESTWRERGSLLADYAIVKNEGQVKALVLHDTGFDFLEVQYRAFLDRLSECDTCEVLDDQTFTFADLATSVPRLSQQMAQRSPDFNTFYIDYDYAVPSALQGLRSVGVEDKIVLGSDGTSAAIELIRSDGGQTATTAYALGWIGWADIDAMNRLFAGESPEPAAEALSVKLIDHDVTTEQDIEGLWGGDADFKAAYLQLWGVES